VGQLHDGQRSGPTVEEGLEDDFVDIGLFQTAGDHGAVAQRKLHHDAAIPPDVEHVLQLGA
jgi:hypothetical protein